MTLARMLYRQLLRRARQHDRHPALKSLLVNPQAPWQRLSASLSEAASSSSSSSGSGSGGSPKVIVYRSGTGSAFVEKMLRAVVRGVMSQPAAVAADKQAPAGAATEEKQQESTGEEGSAVDNSSAGGSSAAPAAAAPSLHPASDAFSRWLAEFFRGRDYYLPLPAVSMEAIVRREFRLPLPAAPDPVPPAAAAAAALAATAKRSGAAAAAVSSSPPSPLTQLTNRAFEILRSLNRNHAEGTKRQLLLLEQDVALDPAFQPPEIAPRPPVLLRQGDAAAAGDSVTEPSSLPEGFCMTPTTELRVGTFLVAHPLLENTFGRTVVLLTRAAGSSPRSSGTSSDAHLSDRVGAAGVVINTPFELSSTLGDRLPKRLKLADPLRLLQACALQDGGPVLDRPTAISGGARVAVTHLLHRLPLLAPISAPVIAHATFPVWMLEVPRMEEAAALIEAEINAAAAAAAAATEKSAAVTALSSSTVSPAAARAPSASAVFLPSDLVSYEGYAEWAPGQLEDELARGSWMLVQGSGAHVFSSSATDAEAIAAAAESNGAETNDGAAAATTKKASGRRKKKVVEAAAAIDGAPSSVASPAAAEHTFAPLPIRLDRPFLQSRLWSHAMHVHGGEARHWAHMPRVIKDAESDADFVTELLAGRKK